MAEELSVQNIVKKSKIVKYKLEEDCVTLRRAGLSYQQIADELNSSGKVPDDDKIDKYVLIRFFDSLPEIQQQLVKEDKKRLIAVVDNNMDIVSEVTQLFSKTKNLLEAMEDDAESKGRFVNPYQYKAVVGEMREMLKQMTDIQREINDFDNIKMFMQIVLEVIKEECPDKLPIIADRLKSAKGTSWFSSLIK